jgi:hypothetical protein
MVEMKENDTIRNDPSENEGDVNETETKGMRCEGVKV